MKTVKRGLYRSHRQNILMIAAAVISVSCGLLGGSKKKGSRDLEGPSGGEGDSVPSLALYQDCGELQADIRSQLQQRQQNDEARQRHSERLAVLNKIRGQVTPGPRVVPMMDKNSSGPDAADSSTKAAASNNSAGSDGATNVQEKGVDESDFVKVGPHHIYVRDQSWVKVSARASLRQIGSLSIADLTRVTLYTHGERLMVIGVTGPRAVPIPGIGRGAPEFVVQNQAQFQTQTVVRIYDAPQDKMPTLAKEHAFRGEYLDTRLLEGDLVTVFRDTLPFRSAVVSGDTRRGRPAVGQPLATSPNVDIEDRPITLDEGDQSVRDVQCSAIAKPIIQDLDFRLSRITVVHTTEVDRPVQHLATIGGGDLIYMTTRNLYVLKANRTWWPWIDPAQTDAVAAQARLRARETLFITKVSLTRDGQLVPTAVGSVAGRVKDQWALKTLGDDRFLTVATTTGQVFAQGEREALNHLYVLEQEGQTLKEAAPVQSFAPGEDIRSVRHVGPIAYIVTFKKTDPLFAFDLSEPRRPQLLGELKIPGFSTYMHPLGDGRLLGLGFDAIDQGNVAFFDGIQVSLFDTKDPRQMARLDQHVLGGRGSASDATSDHHAFYYDANARLIGIPAVIVSGSAPARPGFGTQDLEFSGAVLYRWEGDRINEVARISHSDLIPDRCKSGVRGTSWWQDRYQSLDINRMFTIDGRLISISRFGIKSHDLQDPGRLVMSYPFDRSGDDACNQPPPVSLPRAGGD